MKTKKLFTLLTASSLAFWMQACSDSSSSSAEWEEELSSSSEEASSSSSEEKVSSSSEAAESSSSEEKISSSSESEASSSSEAIESSSSAEESSGTLFVFGSDYMSGELRWVENGGLSDEKMAFNQDSKLIAIGKNLLVLERYGADNLSLVDAEKQVVWQVSLESGDNPSDAVKIDDSKIWVALEGAPKILQVSLTDGKTLKTVETAAFSSAGSLSPNLVDLEVSGDTLFALFQRYVFDSQTYTTSFPKGLLAMYKLSDGALLDTVQLDKKNPMAMAFVGGNLYVASQGEYNSTYGTDADDNRGIEKVDLKTRTSELVVSGEQLGGGVYAMAVDAENSVAYAAVYQTFGTVPVVKVDLTSLTVATVSDVSDAEGSLLFAAGTLYIGDRVYGNEAVFAYDGSAVLQLDNSVGALAPYSIAFVK